MTSQPNDQTYGQMTEEKVPGFSRRRMSMIAATFDPGQIMFATFPIGRDDRVSINVVEISSYRGHTVTLDPGKPAEWTLVRLRDGGTHDVQVSHEAFERHIVDSFSDLNEGRS